MMNNPNETRKLHRVGIVGSRFGGEVHIPAFRAQGRFEVVAIASPNGAVDVARERRIPHAFSSLEEMLANVDLDVVSIAAPPFAHETQTLTALAAGAHVLCEKPMALDPTQARAMRDAAARSGRITALAHEFRYLPCVLAMRELIANMHLGPLREIEITWFTQRMRASADRENSWFFERARGGGMTGAILSHIVDLAIHLAGRPPRRIEGFERTANPARRSGNGTFSSDVADGAFALLDFGDGLVARLSTDATRPMDLATIAIHGETRTVVAAGSNPTETTTFTIDEEETAELELRASPHANLSAAHRNLPAFIDLLDRFSNAIDGKPAELPTFDDGLVTQEVLAKIGYLPR